MFLPWNSGADLYPHVVFLRGSVKYVVGLNKVIIVTLKDFVDAVVEVCGDLRC